MSITGMTLAEFCRHCIEETREMERAHRKWLRLRRKLKAEGGGALPRQHEPRSLCEATSLPAPPEAIDE